jgi:hypothetical protein
MDHSVDALNDWGLHIQLPERAERWMLEGIQHIAACYLT